MGAGEPRFGVLGPLLIEVDGRPMPPPGSGVVRGLLGVLLLAGGRSLTAEHLIELVWADRAERTGRGPVQAAVSRLRDWLGRLPGGGPPVEYDSGGYRLVLRADAVDAGRFRALVLRAATTSDPATRCEMLDAALTLRRGPVLADLVSVDRAGSLMREAEDAVHRAAVAFAEAAIAAGRPGSAIPRLTVLAEEQPLDEELQAVLIELMSVDGRPADALRHHQKVRERITGEIGVEPGARVQRAYLTVLARDRDHGPGPLVETTVPPPAQLPPGIADFTGRDAEADLLARTLDVTGAPVVTAVSGPGGVGKTVLALHVAHRLAARFPGGQLYADLGAELSEPADPSRVLGGFLAALGIAGPVVPEALEERTALFRSLLAGRRVLIVLDNASSEGQVRPLLPGSPGSAVIVTSRAHLAGLESARPVELEVFGAHEATGLLAQIAGADRIAAEPEAAAEIARLCAYVPLAVRIAGARLAGRRHWSLAYLATRLGDEHRRLDELSAGDLAIRAGFAVSYSRLPADTRRLFRLLGLLDVTDFAGWVAAALLDLPVDQAQAHLEALVDSQLLDLGSSDPAGGLRYRCHDLVRLYARERAREEDSASVQAAALTRAFGGWLALSERAAELVPGPCYAAIHGDAPRWRLPSALTDTTLRDPAAWFDAEWTALVAAAGQACELGLDEFAWDLAACLEKYFDVRCMTVEWRETHERALQLCRSAGNRRGEAVLLRGLLEVTTWNTTAPSGTAMTTLRERSLRLLHMFEELGEPRGMADALVNCAWGLVAEGQADEALAAAERALTLAREHGHLGGQARARHVMGIACAGSARIEAAIDHLTRALGLARELGNPRFEATAMQFLGAAHWEAGRIDTGHDLLVDSLVMCHARGDRYAEVFSLLYLAKLYAGLGDARARPTAEAVLSVSRRYGMRHHLADSLKVLGDLDMVDGRFASATLRLEESVLVWRSRGWSSFLAATLRSLGHAHAGTGESESAAKAWTEALTLFEELSDTTSAAEVSALLADTCAVPPCR
ncbi:BTAD domain-containing putative transcriptional regulator [Actinoallomurus bryophytorum]|uniref:DNA-binding SARP family transcriptional activator n=1 Tax=Actinoallomurus bryophytorum TaxID=1490222 RepID=A0A543CTN8_9ACTN|nr:BTAD domain-containing putative transcriptional regulator [Actinoallomurus bryophytorum]TQM00278.1 DNA-binding SARP family transcriptional activator [Actinoallomurus bryophytorum]